MSTTQLTITRAGSREDRYRQAEQDVWRKVGLDPVERFVELDEPRVRLRVLEVGEGEPLLFVHGTAGPGAWPGLIRELKGFRCLMLERPGWGLSSSLDFSTFAYGTVTANLLRGVLMGLGIDRAGVIGNSIGNVWALRAAAQNPSLVTRVVLLGGGPVVPEVHVPGIIRLIASPIGAIMVRMPDNPSRIRSILRAGGHDSSVDAGRLDDFIEWRAALGRNTESMRHERGMVRAIVRGSAWRPGLTFDDAELAAIRQPTLVVYGTADSTGTEAIWRRVADLMPQGQIDVVDGAGHEPWFEEAARVASDIRGFLGGPSKAVGA